MQGFEFIAGGQVRPFRYFAQKVLPTVYDDSLSYLELLEKMELYLNEVITAVNANSDATTELQGLYEEFTETVNGMYAEFTADVNSQLDVFRNYFDNLDVQEEVDNKLDALVADGTMSRLILPIVQAEVGDDIDDVVDAWLVAHPEATTTVQDGAVTTAKLANGAVTLAKLGTDVEDAFDSKADVDAYAPLLTAGVAESLLSSDEQQATFTNRESEGASVGIHAILGNTEVVGTDLVSVNIDGISTTGFNIFDGEMEAGYINTITGVNDDTVLDSRCRCVNYIPVIPSTIFYANYQEDERPRIYYYNRNKEFISSAIVPTVGLFTTPSNCWYIRFFVSVALTDYSNIICININDPVKNGTYEPYSELTREIPMDTYFPNGLRGAGTAHDELRRDKAIVRIGAVDLGTLAWVKTADARLDVGYFFEASATSIGLLSGTLNRVCSKYQMLEYRGLTNIISVYGSDVNHVTFASTADLIYVIDSTYTDAALFKSAMSGVYLFYELATPTETAINPPINMDYQTQSGGVESIVVPTGEMSAPMPLVYVQGYDANGVADKALSVIAPLEGAKASTNYAIGSYFVHDGKLYKSTSAIATGETITPGTNCALTTVMAEIMALA